MTKISQSQIKGTGKVDLGTELSAVEEAIKAAVGGASYESRAELSLSDIGGLISKEADGRLGLDQDVKGNGKSVGGLRGITAVTSSFEVSSLGYAMGTEATFGTTHAGTFDASSAFVRGPLEVSGTSVFRQNVAADKDVTIGGNLYVNGSTVSMDTVSVQIADNNLVIAKGKPALTGGEGFSLVDDAGSKFMRWDASGKWSISDGILSPAAVIGSKVQVDDKGIKSLVGNPLAVKAATSMHFQDSFMPGPMDLSKAGEFGPVFGPGAWADGLGLIGALGRLRVDSGAALLAASGSLVAALDAERIRAMAAEAALQAEIDAEEAARAAADTAHDAAIAAEVAARIAGDATLTTNLTAEVSRAQAAEGVLDGKIATEKSRAEAAELVLTNGLAAEVAARIADVNAEESRALAAELVLDGKISTEKSRAEAAELVLDGKITAEKNRAEAAELVLTNGLAAEIARAQGAEATLTTNLTAEITRAQAAEGVLNGKITTEKNRAEAAELVLTNAIAAEVSRAQAAEGVLDGKIVAETNRAVAAEGVLDGKITTLSGKIATQATRIFVAVVPNGPDLAADSDLTGYPAAEFVMPAGKASANYDVYLNGQQMMWNADFAFVAGKLQFKFALKAGDVVRFREF